MSKITVPTKTERKRGCGYRKNGHYLVADGPASVCGKLPIIIEPCTCCGMSLNQTRDFQWIPHSYAKGLLASKLCDLENDLLATYMGSGGKRLSLPIAKCDTCSLSKDPGDVGLIWVGEKFYRSPELFLIEASKMGVSRRISRVPREFKLGETWVWLAHPKGVRITMPADPKAPLNRYQERLKAMQDAWLTAKLDPENPTPEPTEIFLPAIFAVFKPQRIEYVVNDTETQEELAAKIKKGITPVRVKRENQQMPMFHEGDVDAVAKEVEKLTRRSTIPTSQQTEILRQQLQNLMADFTARDDKEVVIKIKNLQKALGVK